MKITKEGEYFIFVHYLSKFLDLLDTVFICLKKKDRQLIFLHVYHHATIGQIWGLLLYIGWGAGTALFGANINSFVHVRCLHVALDTLYMFLPFFLGPSWVMLGGAVARASRVFNGGIDVIR